MTQDEKWLARYNEVKTFMETNHRNPSKHRLEEEHDMLNWLKADQFGLDGSAFLLSKTRLLAALRVGLSPARAW